VKRTVRVLRRAAADIVEIDRYLARESPSIATRVIDDLLDAIDSLAELAERAPRPRDETLRARGYRFLSQRPYLVFFKIKGRQVRVHRVLHGRRAYARLL
jgi:plasmid stabilization system protein ParE